MTAKKYPALNLRLSQDLKENLDFLAKQFKITGMEGAYPKLVRMAIRSLKVRIELLDREFGRDFTEVFKFKVKCIEDQC